MHPRQLRGRPPGPPTSLLAVLDRTPAGHWYTVKAGSHWTVGLCCSRNRRWSVRPWGRPRHHHDRQLLARLQGPPLNTVELATWLIALARGED